MKKGILLFRWILFSYSCTHPIKLCTFRGCRTLKNMVVHPPLIHVQLNVAGWLPMVEHCLGLEDLFKSHMPMGSSWPQTQSRKSWKTSAHLIIGRALVILGTSGSSSSFLSMSAFHWISKLLIT